jgi:hypothetical protein
MVVNGEKMLLTTTSAEAGARHADVKAMAKLSKHVAPNLLRIAHSAITAQPPHPSRDRIARPRQNAGDIPKNRRQAANFRQRQSLPLTFMAGRIRKQPALEFPN